MTISYGPHITQLIDTLLAQGAVEWLDDEGTPFHWVIYLYDFDAVIVTYDKQQDALLFGLESNADNDTGLGGVDTYFDDDDNTVDVEDSDDIDLIVNFISDAWAARITDATQLDARLTYEQWKHSPREWAEIIRGSDVY